MMEETVHIKTEPDFSRPSDIFVSSADGLHGSHLSPVYGGLPDDPSYMKQTATEYIMKPMDNNQSLYISTGRKNEFYSSEKDSQHQSTYNQTLNYANSLSHQCSEQPTNTTFHSSDSIISENPETHSHKVSSSKPSEALFVRTLIPKCKRIAPLWFRGVSSMRERNREENRRMACNSGQSQSDWSLIGSKIAEMNSISETDAVANLLKKLYKELPSDSVYWFLKCWLGSDDTLQDPDSCVISRGDAKGRMRRIDGGKGSDKVWRLDTIVGMLYHGLPMSSTDTNIMVHTCDQELCVRPQHIRFRASSVALVVVLKALAQAGYTVIPPPIAAGPNGVAPNAFDESVDVFGPFSIEKLQQYRSENLNPAPESISKLSLSASDRELVDSEPVIKAALQAYKMEPSPYPMTTTHRSSIAMNGPLAHVNGQDSHIPLQQPPLLRRPSGSLSNPSEAALSPARQFPTSHGQTTLLFSSNLLTIPNSDSSSSTSSLCSSSSTSSCQPVTTVTCTTTVCCSSTLLADSGTPFAPTFITSSASVPGDLRHSLKSERRSLKRPPPSNSPCSFPSSPARLSHAAYHPSTSPPLLISEAPTGTNRTSHLGHPLRRPSDSTLLTKTGIHSASVITLPCLGINTSSAVSIAPTNIIANTNTPAFDLLSNKNTHLFVTSQSGPNFNQTITQQQQQQHQAPPHPQLYANANLNSGGMDHSICIPYPSTSSTASMVCDDSPNSQPRHCLAQTNVLIQQQPLNGIPHPHHHLHHQQHPQQQQQQHLSNPAPISTTITAQVNSGYSSSGKSTPRQPAKKRLEARTPTIEGSGDELGGTTTPNMLGSSMDEGSLLSGLGSSTPFQIHQNTPFVPVHGRSGRPCSTDSAHSLNYANANLSCTNLASSTSSTITSLTQPNCPNSLSQGGPDTQLASKLTSKLSSLANPPLPAQDEEAEMDQELVDIMVGRSASNANYVFANHDSSANTAGAGAAVATTSTVGGIPGPGANADTGPSTICHSPTTLSLLHPDGSILDRGCSSNGRRIIAAMVAALANTQESPMPPESSNPRRSASASSLPLLGPNPNEDFAELLLNSASTLTTHLNPSQTQTNINSLQTLGDTIRTKLVDNPPDSSVRTNPKLHISERRQVSVGELNLSTNGPVRTAVAGGPNSGADSNGLPTVSTPQESIQDLASLIRNSPASGISQELIEILENMAQQYGMQQPRAGSRASRPSSQVAQHFYRSLVNGSVCGSPFSFPSTTTTCGSTVFNFPNSSNGTVGSNGSNTLTQPNSLGQSCNSNNGFNSMASALSVHHLRSLSFTPLSVDSDTALSQSSGVPGH